MNKLTVVLVSLLGISIFSLFYQRDYLIGLEESVSNWEDSVSYYHNKEGELIAQKRIAGMTIRDLREVNHKLGIDRDRLKDQVGNLKNLNSYYKSQIESIGTGKAVTLDTVVQIVYDTDTVMVNAQSVDWSNNYLSIDGLFIPKFNRWDFNYSYNVDLEITSYYKKSRSGLFAPKELVVDFKLSDPNAKAVDLKALKIIRERRWYQSTGFKIGAGIVGGFFLANQFN